MGTSMNLYVSQHTSGMLQGSVRDDVKFTAYGRAIRFVMGINVDVGYKGYVHCVSHGVRGASHDFEPESRDLLGQIRRV